MKIWLVLFSVLATVALAEVEVTDISAGGSHTCAVMTGGSIKCWGSNFEGQLGMGLYAQDKSTRAINLVPIGNPVEIDPSKIGIISTATSVALGGVHSCAVLTGGAIKCWGENNAGQLGDGTTTSDGWAVDVSGITTATSIALGASHSCALLTGGTIKCWGDNGFGELGDGTATQRTTPVDVSGISTATSIALGTGHSCALLTGGAIKCWGLNGYGQLGDGTTTQRATPVDVSGITTATSIALARWAAR